MKSTDARRRPAASDQDCPSTMREFFRRTQLACLVALTSAKISSTAPAPESFSATGSIVSM